MDLPLKVQTVSPGGSCQRTFVAPRRFEPAETRVIEVTKDFPRLTSGYVPAGIMKAMYEIDLDKAPGENVGAEGALKKLGAI